MRYAYHFLKITFLLFLATATWLIGYRKPKTEDEPAHEGWDEILHKHFNEN